MGRSSFALRWAALGVAVAWGVCFLSSDFFDRLGRERVLLAFGHAHVAAPFERTVLTTPACPPGSDCPPEFQAVPVLSLPIRHLTSLAVMAVCGLLFAAAWRERRRPQ